LPLFASYSISETHPMPNSYSLAARGTPATGPYRLHHLVTAAGQKVAHYVV